MVITVSSKRKDASGSVAFDKMANLSKPASCSISRVSYIITQPEWPLSFLLL